jgi:hypothetical protein
MRRDSTTFKETVNRAIRLGLSQTGRKRTFRQRTVAMGFNPDIPYDKALRLAGQLEDQEILRKLSMGK